MRADFSTIHPEVELDNKCSYDCYYWSEDDKGIACCSLLKPIILELDGMNRSETCRNLFYGYSSN